MAEIVEPEPMLDPSNYAEDRSNDELQREIDLLTAENNTLSQQFREISNENADMRERTEFLEGEIAELLTEVENLKISVEDERAAREAADLKVLEMEHQVEASQNALEDVQISYPSRNDQSAEIARLRELVAEHERQNAAREAKEAREAPIAKHNGESYHAPPRTENNAAASAPENAPATATAPPADDQQAASAVVQAQFSSISLGDEPATQAPTPTSSSPPPNPFSESKSSETASSAAVIHSNKPIEFSLKVGSPEVHGDGTSKYTTYTIETEHPRLQAGVPASVARRYSEFVWLHARLEKTVLGAIVPPLPEKVMFGRFTDKVVESRCRALELFLKRVLGHQQLCSHPDVVGFLCEDKTSFDARKSKKDREPEETSKKGFGDRFRELRLSMTNRLSEKTPEKTFEDLQCDKATTYAKELAKVLAKGHKCSLGVVAASRELATNWFNFALSMTELGKTEQVEDSNLGIGEALIVWSEKADRMSVKMNEYADETTVKCEEPLRDYVRLVDALLTMMSKRRECLVHYQTQAHQLSDVQKRYDAIKGDDKKQEKALTIQGELPQLEQKATSAKQELERVTQSALAEVAQFKEQKARDIGRLMGEVINSQMNLAKNIDTTWGSD